MNALLKCAVHIWMYLGYCEFPVVRYLKCISLFYNMTLQYNLMLSLCVITCSPLCNEASFLFQYKKVCYSQPVTRNEDALSSFKVGYIYQRCIQIPFISWCRIVLFMKNLVSYHLSFLQWKATEGDQWLWHSSSACSMESIEKNQELVARSSSHYCYHVHTSRQAVYSELAIVHSNGGK